MKISPENTKKLNTLIQFFLNGDTDNYLFFRYYLFNIYKRDGRHRQICCPNKNLKFVQSWINTNILQDYPLPDCVTGFRKYYSIKDNAKVHLRRKYIYCLDISDFFPSISADKVRAVFQGARKADLLTKICTFNGWYLPQGAPTSPALANIVFSPTDQAIIKICDYYKIRYTRYADDLTFSGNDRTQLLKAVALICKQIEYAGFAIHKKKSRLMSGKYPLLVTGLRLNSGKVSIGRRRKKLLRAQIHNWLVNGNCAEENQIKGNLAYLKSIEPQTYRKFKKYMEKLREKTTIDQIRSVFEDKCEVFVNKETNLE